jgi:hypothetical protein
MAQESQYVKYLHLFINGVYIPECYKVGEITKTIDTVDIVKAPDKGIMWKRKLQTSVYEATAIEFEMYKRKDTKEHVTIYDWVSKRDQRNVTLIETDNGADPFDLNAIVMRYDLGKCDISTQVDSGSDRTSPAAGTLRFTLNPEYIKELFV